jgi:GGDEF domain-containing protein
MVETDSKSPSSNSNEPNLALECYVTAIRNIAHYAIDTEPELAASHRKYLEQLADSVEAGNPESLEESRATLRALLRDHRDKTSRHLNLLRSDLNSAADALAEMLEAFGDTDGEQGEQLRSSLLALRRAPGEDCVTIRDTVVSAADTIESNLSNVRKRHQMAVSEFMIEIRMLHKRIDELERAASVDMVTRLFPRQEMEQRIREATEPVRLLLVRADGILQASSRFGPAVADELSGAVTRRLRNALPEDATVARWNGQAFVAILDLRPHEAAKLAERVAANLSGAYACLKDGKAVRPPVSPDVRVVEISPENCDASMRQAAAFLGE